MRFKAIYATMVLGWQFFLRLLKRLFFRPSPGLAEFLENYRADQIPAMSPEDKSILHALGRCVSCRLCDSLCPALPHTNPAEFLGPAFYPAGASRLITDYRYAQLDLAACSDCSGCESICPRDVPIRATFELMRKKVQEAA